jgi:hypothetical protein
VAIRVIGGDYLSAASFLGILGRSPCTDTTVSAEPLRDLGKYTLADVLAYRLRPGPVRTAAAVSTLAVRLFYLLAQMAGAGGPVNLGRLGDLDHLSALTRSGAWSAGGAVDAGAGHRPGLQTGQGDRTPAVLADAVAPLGEPGAGGVDLGQPVLGRPGQGVEL